jgi:hypothetical protein
MRSVVYQQDCPTEAAENQQHGDHYGHNSRLAPARLGRFCDVAGLGLRLGGGESDSAGRAEALIRLYRMPV